MKHLKKERAVLVLEDGTVFEGKAVGFNGITTGEICFNTGMTGYQEIFTDPSYYGQIMVMTTAHIGNYGVHRDEVESDSMKIAGLVVKKFSDIYSRPDGDQTLQQYLEDNKVVGICDLDTRALVRHIRHKGAMNCLISSSEFDMDVLKKKLSETPSMDGLELSSKVSTKEPYYLGEEDKAEHRIAVLDLGVKKNILRNLVSRNCYLKVFPMESTYQEMIDWNPDGFMISNGPGDPSAMHGTIDLLKEIIEHDHPVFGICLGHQIIALAHGIETEKMFNGHRGINHPVKNLITGKCEVTSQNHGFVLNRSSVEANQNFEITHVHLNDNTVAGLSMKEKNVFTVQYHPEASPGPNDANYLFDNFINNIVNSKALTTK